MMRTVVADGKNITLTGQAGLTETLLKTVTIKAGTLTANSYLIIDIFVNNVASSAISMSLYFGGQGPSALNVNSDGTAGVGGTGGTGWIRVYLFNANAQSVQKMVGQSAVTSGLAENGVLVTSVNFTTTTVFTLNGADTTQDSILKLTGSLGVAGDTISVRGWFVRAVKSDF